MGSERGAEGEGGGGDREPHLQFPTPSPEFVDGAARRLLRLKESSGGGAEAAEVRAGELPGAPSRSGNGLAERRGRAGGALLLVAARHAGTRARPALSAPGLGRAGVGRAARLAWPGPRPRGAFAGPPAPGLQASGPERGNVSGPCCRQPRRARSPHALPRAAPARTGRGLRGRHPLRRRSMNGEPGQGGSGRDGHLRGQSPEGASLPASGLL